MSNKNLNKKIFYIRVIFSSIILLAAILGITGLFYPIKVFDIQLFSLIQRNILDFTFVSLVALILALVFTFIFGRLYCSCICPLGILQEAFGIICRKLFKRNGSKRSGLALKYFIAVASFAVFFGGTSIIFRFLDPYAAFGSGFTLASWGLIVAAAIAAAVFFKDRIFCVDICPVGTVLGLISKISLNKIYIDASECVSCKKCEKLCPSECIDANGKTVDNEACVKCLKCLSSCPKGALHFGIKREGSISFSPDRRKIITAVAAGFIGLLSGGGVLLLKNAIKRKSSEVILPPGAGNEEDFFNRCLNCNLCVQHCPEKIIKKADGQYGAVSLDYSKNFCRYDCRACSQVCPSGALKRLSLDEKRRLRIGVAVILSDKCVNCGACVSACPCGAITIADGKTVVIDASKCIGCGACGLACPVKSITIYPVKEQKFI